MVDESAGISRRSLLRYGLAGASVVAVPGLLAACGDDSGGGATTGGGDSSGSLTFASNGGALQDAQSKAWLEPYGKTNPNLKIVQDVGSTDYAKLEAMVKSGNVTWDLVDVAADFGLRPDQQALLEKLDCNVVDCSVEGGNAYRVPLHKYAAVMVYAPGEVSSAPKTWAEWWDLDTYPGKRVMWKESVGTGVWEAALLADGVAIDALYPLDVDRALKKLDEIRSEMIWAPSPTDTVKLVADGEAVLGLAFSSQAYAISKDGDDVPVIWNQYGLGGDYLVVPKGAPNKAAAMKLAAYMTSAEHNADLPNIYPVAPGNPDTRPDKKSPTFPYLPTGKGGTSYAFDERYYMKNSGMLAERFTEWLQS